MDEDEIQISDGTDEPVPAEPTTAAELAAEPAAWAGPSQEEWQQVMTTQAHLASLLQQADQYTDPNAAYYQQLEPTAEDWDPFDRDAMRGLLEEVVAERVGPIQSYVQQSQQQETMQVVDGWLKQATEQAGGFKSDKSQTFARFVAPQFLGETVTPFQPQGNAQTALSKAAQHVAAYEKELMDLGVKLHFEDLKRRNEAPTDATPTAVPTAAAEIVTFDKGEDELAFARKFAERVRLGAAG